MAWIEKKLRLKINEAKSGTGSVGGRKFLGFSLSVEGVIEVAEKSVKRFKEKIRELWDGRQSKTNEELRDQWNRYIRGWSGYFRLAEELRDLRRLEGWIRRHIRKCFWQRWHSAGRKAASLAAAWAQRASLAERPQQPGGVADGGHARDATGHQQRPTAPTRLPDAHQS